MASSSQRWQASDRQRSLGNGATLRVVSTQDKDSDLYVGCSYEQDAS
ncbi:hypothetical protein BSG18_18910 [Pseudomonas ogarae]|nr:hypothetical protein [Pseudomonas ogarae]PBJ09973.1 hypothetical protein BSF43_28330 [Pseudomonas ogarae]PBJ23868.1 hypothetical protein BSG18_18910 [Pseudomonas ogarae]